MKEILAGELNCNSSLTIEGNIGNLVCSDCQLNEIVEGPDRASIIAAAKKLMPCQQEHLVPSQG